MKLYKQYKKEIGKWPSFTCPFINEAISELEKLRAQNNDLREALEKWRDATKEMSNRLDTVNDILKKVKIDKGTRREITDTLYGDSYPR